MSFDFGYSDGGAGGNWSGSSSLLTTYTDVTNVTNVTNVTDIRGGGAIYPPLPSVEVVLGRKMTDREWLDSQIDEVCALVAG